ncbi:MULTISPECIES: hypothetical protein [unclassified Sphingomonas]|jgi:hypothetical protein|uniref:hypothetical protein n=1 Tax=unclassified Sphingomonas TaxID=196159 RepID=UPI000AAF5722|nr:MULTISPECIES: hypothetical protein [unclassified Sphingomonas]
MDPFRNLPEPPAEAAPLVYYILPRAEPVPDAPIGPGDLEIEFEPDWEAEDE